MYLFRLHFPRFIRLSLLASFAMISVLPTSFHHAYAQSTDEAEAEQDMMEAQKKSEARKEARRNAPPSALPGAESDDEDQSHARLDLNPTAALFDAINNGSLMAAKEALNRGADVDAKNVLEQTPLDMAIDLGRNDIMFLLLSMRTYNPDGHLMGDVHHGDITEGDNTHHMKINGQAGISATPHMAKKLLIDGGKPNPPEGFLGFGGPTAPENTVTTPVKRNRYTSRQERAQMMTQIKAQ